MRAVGPVAGPRQHPWRRQQRRRTPGVRGAASPHHKKQACPVPPLSLSPTASIHRLACMELTCWQISFATETRSSRGYIEPHVWPLFSGTLQEKAAGGDKALEWATRRATAVWACGEGCKGLRRPPTRGGARRSPQPAHVLARGRSHTRIHQTSGQLPPRQQQPHRVLICMICWVRVLARSTNWSHVPCALSVHLICSVQRARERRRRHGQGSSCRSGTRGRPPRRACHAQSACPPCASAHISRAPAPCRAAQRQPRSRSTHVPGGCCHAVDRVCNLVQHCGGLWRRNLAHLLHLRAGRTTQQGRVARMRQQQPDQTPATLSGTAAAAAAGVALPLAAPPCWKRC